MPRQRININREWTFIRADVPGAESAALDDANWQSIHLPHCFDIPYFRTPDFYVGVGWYRKQINLPIFRGTGVSPVHSSEASTFHMGATPVPRNIPRNPDDRVFIEFGAAFQDAQVFLNGHRVGRHLGGYSAFQFDITDFLTSADNVIAVRVSNEWNPQLVPRAGEHIFSGGIYRDVHLITTSAIHADWHGVSITTPHLSADSATVRVQTRIRNGASDERRCTVSQRVVDPRGRLIAQMHSHELAIPADGVTVFDQTSPVIESPQLWHPDHPHLYSIVTEVHDGDELVDEIHSTFGFRWFEWTPDRGFFLNGEHLYLRGANAHQDIAGWGIAATAASAARDVQLIKDAGFNFIRGAHYPHHPAFADACDRVGLLFWSENCFWGKGGFAGEGYWNASAYPVNPEDFAPFEQSCKDALREMINENFNHPSIIAWSMTNEAFFTFNVDRARDLIKSLVDLSHELDPTRPAAIGGAQRGDFDKLGDIAGYNGDGARLFINPGVPNLVSEYGALSKGQPGEYAPYFGELQLDERPRLGRGTPLPIEFVWRSGQAIWCAFDYGTIAGKQGLKGIIDHFRIPKRSWYWYRNEYRNVPPPPWPRLAAVQRTAGSLIIKLISDKLTIATTDGTDDVLLSVALYDADGNRVAHSPPVTLTIDSGPGEFPTGRSIIFEDSSDIRIVEGAAAITFRSYHGGHSVVRATSPGLPDATITITTLGEPPFVPGQTPLCDARPYLPPAPSPAAMRAANSISNVAKDRPSRASSELLDHPARYANDGDSNSFWSAQRNDREPCWLVDLEGFYQLSSSKITFATPGGFRYTVELSLDANTWQKIIDRRQTEVAGITRHDVYPPGATARYIRVTLLDVPETFSASVAEVEIFGVLSAK
jgi:beta-galactosidase